MSELMTFGLAAKEAAAFLAVATTAEKNRALEAISRAITEHKAEILEANR